MFDENKMDKIKSTIIIVILSQLFSILLKKYYFKSKLSTLKETIRIGIILILVSIITIYINEYLTDYINYNIRQYCKHDYDYLNLSFLENFINYFTFVSLLLIATNRTNKLNKYLIVESTVIGIIMSLYKNLNCKLNFIEVSKENNMIIEIIILRLLARYIISNNISNNDYALYFSLFLGNYTYLKFTKK